MPDAVPNYLFSDAAGLVHAIFSGGVRIQADPALNNLENTVTWTNGPNGAAVAQIGAGATGLFNDLRILAESDTVGGYSADIRARAANNAVLDSSVIAEATGLGGSHIDVITRSDGGSDFPQFATTRKSAIGNGAGGSATVGPGLSAGLGPFTAGFPLAGAGSFAFLAVLGAITGGGGPEFFSWAWAIASATQYNVVIHNNHPSSTISAGWAGLPIGIT